MKIAIADDNVRRNDSIKNLLESECNIAKEQIYQYHTTQSLKNALRNIEFNVLILDVVMPKRDERPSAKASFELLNEIDDKNKKLTPPDTIIGITANTDDISEFRKEFEENCSIVIEATRTSSEWKRIIAKKVSQKVTYSLAKESNATDIYCFTVHGIRTRGAWQEKLKREVEQKVKGVEFGNYKYGYFSLFSFFIPPLRVSTINRFARALDSFLAKNKDKRILFFSHSFGTYILIKALEKVLRKREANNICTIVLAGSVLKSSHDFTFIREKTGARIINDCGASDYILTLSEILVPRAGMAGKVGFKGINDSTFVNRIFNGSHSHYFDSECKFIEKYWIPLFSSDYKLETVDERQDNYLKVGIIDKVSSMIGALKDTFYLIIIAFLLFTVFS